MDCKCPQRQGTNYPTMAGYCRHTVTWKHPFSLCPVGPLRLTPKVSSLLGLWQQGHFCWTTWTSSASSLFRISHYTFLLLLFPSFSHYSWFSTLDSNLRVGRLSSWIFSYSLWVLSEQTFWQQKGVRSSGSVRMSVTMEFMQRRQAGLPATARSPQSLQNFGARKSSVLSQSHVKSKRTTLDFSSVNQ